MRFLSFVVIFGIGIEAADARKRKDEGLAAIGPSTSASEIPQLANLLKKGGWTPTPEMSGRYNVGTILNTAMGDHRIVASDCFERPAVVSPFIGAEMVASLQSGVSVSTGITGRFGASGGLVKKLKFGTPTIASLESLYMKLTDQCSGLLKRQDPAQLAKMYVVQEVLKAEIAEQTCGTLDAKGRFAGLGAAEMEYSQACAQETLEPVAVGYRTVALVDFLPEETAEQVRLALGTTVLRDTPQQAPAPKPLPQTIETPEDTADQYSAESQGRFGGDFHLGNGTGLRLQWHLDNGSAVGLRVDGYIGIIYPGALAVIEYERSPSNNRYGWFVGLGAGLMDGSYVVPHVDGGVVLLWGGGRVNMGLGVGGNSSGIVIVPGVSYGWMW